MNKKIITGSLFLILTFMITPIVSAYNPIAEQPIIPQTTTETPEGTLGMATIVVFVLTYTPEQGLQPCQGADIHLRGFLHSYNGTTNEKGIHIFIVQSKLHRERHYIATASIQSQNQTMMRIGFISLRSRQVIYKGFLFVVTGES